MITMRNSLYSYICVVAITFILSVLFGNTFIEIAPGHVLAADPTTLQNETKHQKGDYLIGAGDVLEIMVWKEPDLSRTVRVRPDGKISLPLVDDVDTYQSTILDLKERITKALTEYVEKPAVYVMLQENGSKKIYIVGMVASPGEYLLEKPTTILQAIATAGGFSEWAKKEDIVILRQDKKGQSRIEFNYERVVSGKDIKQNILLNPDDVIIIP